MSEITTRNEELERDLAKMSIALGNESIKNDMQFSDLQTKIKLVSK